MGFPGRVRGFFEDQQADDLAEYCLITALIAIVALVIFVSASGGMQNIWGSLSATVNQANPSGAATGGGARR